MPVLIDMLTGLFGVDVVMHLQSSLHDLPLEKTEYIYIYINIYCNFILINWSRL